METAIPDEPGGALVVAVDDCAPAREALRYAAALAAEMRRPLCVVTVGTFGRGPAPHAAGVTVVRQGCTTA